MNTAQAEGICSIEQRVLNTNAGKQLS